MEKKTRNRVAYGIVAIVVVLVIAGLINSGIINISEMNVFEQTHSYTLRGYLYEVDELESGEFIFHMNDTSHKRFGYGWTFPHQDGIEEFYFTDIGYNNLSDFIYRDIHINYMKNNTISEITTISYTYYDSILQAEEREKSEKCMLILEQRVAGYRICNVFHDMMQDYNFSSDKNLSIVHNECMKYIENLYYVEFDENGDICFCEYNH